MLTEYLNTCQVLFFLSGEVGVTHPLLLWEGEELTEVCPHNHAFMSGGARIQTQFLLTAKIHILPTISAFPLMINLCCITE